MSLTELFNLDNHGWYRKAMKDHFKKTCEAIQANDAPEVEKLLSSIPADRDDFFKKYAEELLAQAIKRGKLESFEPVYKAINKPDYTLNMVYTIDGVTCYGQKPLLIAAIDLRKQAISAFIARDPAVDITQTRGPGETTAYTIATAIMDKGEGMEEVVGVLSERIAFMKTREAEVLLEKAKTEADGLLAQADRLKGQRTSPAA